MNKFEEFLNTNFNKPKTKYKSIYNLKGFQLKNIIEQYNKKYPEKEIKKYKTQPMKELDKILHKNKINITDFKIVDINPYSPQNVYKKAGINQYKEEEQNEYLNSLNQNTRYDNPLEALNTYTNKEGIKEHLTPQKHQEQFISQFIYSNLRGAIMFHGVGSGKTLTAVISSYYYLKVYPKNKVIVVSPSALLFNFVAGMRQYGLDINDNRYSFYTYDKYVRNPKIATNALLIVDEAHNFRTEIITREMKDPENPDVVLEEEAVSNKKGFKLMKWGTSKCHKILLLTGTAFVNILYDIENLLAMIDNRKPVDLSCYNDILSKVATSKDYFDYKISYYVKDTNDDFFPKRNEILMPIYMTEQQEKKYNQLKSEGNPNNKSDNPNSFYSAEKYASNMIDKENNPKLKVIVDTILKNKDQKFIVYSGLYDTGVMNIVDALKQQKIQFKMITGKQSTAQKDEAKHYFNYYNFKNKNFFNVKELDPYFHKYINDEIRVLLITKAGAEGVDTINCENIILMDGQWNDALSEQIIARAIRYKSHIALPKNRQQVNVIRTIFSFSKDKKIIDLINSGKADFKELKRTVKAETAEQMKLIKGKDKRYLPTIKELKELKINNSIFIPDKTEIKISKFYGRTSRRQLTRDGWDIYNNLTTPEKREEWRKQAYYDYLFKSKKINNNDKNELMTLTSISIDLYLYILAKSKQATIDEFISFFGNAISLYEKYSSKLQRHLKSMNKKLTELEKIKILQSFKQEELKEVLKFNDDLMKSSKNQRNKKNQLQQFYTNGILAKYIYDYSSLKTNKLELINVLEPSAGVGDLIKPIIIDNNKNVKITLVEFDPDNRKTLNNLIKETPQSITLAEQPNFLLFQSSSRFDYIFMNPPFHLRKNEDYNLLRDVWDYDFVKRAFAFLKVKGELLAIVSNKFLSNKDFMEWSKEPNKIFNFEKRPKEKFSNISIDICVIKIIKVNESEDSDLMKRNFYKKQDVKGKDILNNERKLKLDEDEKLINKMTIEAYKRNRERDLAHEFLGGSIIPSKVSNYISTVFNGRNDLPPSVRNLLDKKGDKMIKSISIGRTPVQSILTGALSAFSGGKFGKRMYKNFDELFHLYIKITLDDNNIYALEKNAVISLTKYQYRNNEEVEPVYNIPSGLTLNKMLENTKNYMGSNFLSYSAVNNNCQDFIVAVFKSNNIGNAKNIEFIKQDTEKLFKKLPVLQKIANFTTDLGAKVDEIAYGAGIKLLF